MAVRASPLQCPTAFGHRLHAVMSGNRIYLNSRQLIVAEASTREALQRPSCRFHLTSGVSSIRAAIAATRTNEGFRGVDQIVPAYWLVRHDILTARQHLNFSTMDSRPAAAQRATLYEAVNMIQLGAMPLPNFVKLHPEAKVTPEELTILKGYLAPWTPAPNQPGTAPGTIGVKTDASPTAPVRLSMVQPEFDGFPFDPTFESWKPISTTDRGDNNTFRFVLGMTSR
jgi:hypothetical protein